MIIECIIIQITLIFYDKLKVSEARQELASIDVSEADLAAFDGIDGRTNAKRDKFVELFYKKMGDHQLAAFAASLRQNNDPLDVLHNTDPLGDTGLTFIEALLETATPEMRAATIASQERALSAPSVLNNMLNKVMSSAAYTDEVSSLFDVASEMYGPSSAQRLVDYQKSISKNRAPRRMGTPSGEKSWGMKVTGAERALPSGNFATEGLTDADGRMKHFQSLLDDTFNVELRNFKDYVRQKSLDEGFEAEQAEAIAEKMYYEKLDRLASNRENFVTRNSAMLDGRINEIKSQIADLKDARQKYTASLAKLPAKYKSELSARAGTRVLDDGTTLETFQYTMSQGRMMSDEDKLLVKNHYNNLARLREAREKYGTVRGRNVIIKDGNKIPIGDLIKDAEQEIQILRGKKDRTLKIKTRGYRTSADASVNEDHGLADHMGRSQLRAGDGTYEGGKIQSFLKKSGAYGFHGRLIKQGMARGLDGQMQRTGASINALNEMLTAKTQQATQRMVKNPFEMERNKVRLQTLNQWIKRHEALTKGIQKIQEGQQKTIKIGNEKLNEDQANETLFATEQYIKANVLESTFETQSESQTLIGGLKKERSYLSQTTEQQLEGDKQAVQVADLGRTLLKKTALETSRRFNDLAKKRDRLEAMGQGLSREEVDLMYLLIEVRRQQNKLVAYHQRKNTLIDADRADKINRLTYTKLQKAAAARKRYEREVAEGMYDYETSTAAGEERMSEAEEAIAVDNAAYLEQLNRADPDAAGDATGSIDLYFGGEPTLDQQAEINARTDAMNAQETAQNAVVPDYQALAAKAENGELSREELLAAIGDLQNKIAEITPAKVVETKPVGTKRPPMIATTASGIEIDVNNDIRYFRNKSDESINVELDGQLLGKIRRGEDGSVSIKHPDGMNLKFKSNDVLKKSLAQIFHRKIEAIQEASKGNRFAVNQAAVGLPHVQTNPKKTETYKNDPVEVTEEDLGNPEESPPVKSNPDDKATWTSEDFDVPAGRRLAIQFVEKGGRAKVGEVRVAGMKGKKDARQPQAIGDLLGKSGSVQYVIGHVQAGGGKIANRETFFPMTETDSFIDQRGNVVTGDSVPKGQRGVSPSTQSNRKRENRASKFDDVRANKLTMSEQDKLFFVDKGETLNTVDDLVNFIDRIETIDWQSEIVTLQGLKRYATLRGAAARLLKTNVPNGIKQPTTNMRVATNRLRSMFDGYSDREVQTSLDFLERIAAYNGGRAPLLAKATGDEASFDPNTNEIKVVVGPTSGKRATPMSMELVHEMGHWVYENLLDEGDRQKFWSSLEKFYDDNQQLDFAELSQGMVDTKLISNAASSPQEFFANQFLGYVLQTDALRVPGSPMMQVFDKVSQIGAKLLNFLLGRTTFKVDPDLAQIFQKYLPDEEIDALTGTPTRGPSKFAHLEAIGKEHGIEPQNQTGTGEMTMAQFAGKQMVALDERIRDLQLAKMANPRGLGDSFALAVELEKIAKSVYGDYGGKKGQPKHARIPGRPDSGTTRIMALDYANNGQVLEDIMQAQYKIHGFLKNLRAEEADHKFADALSGKNQTDVAQQNAIASEMSTDTQRDVQDMYEKMLTQSKSAYEGLDEAIVDRLHALSTDLQNAMQRGIGEYTRIFKRNMPHSQRKFVAIDEYTGASYVETLSPKSAKFKALNARQKQKELAQQQAVSDIVGQLTQRGIDWRSIGEEEILAAAGNQAHKTMSEVEAANILHNQAAADDAQNLSGMATAINTVQERVSYVVKDAESFIAKLERDDSPILSIFRGDDEEAKAKLMQKIQEQEPSDFNLALLDYGRAHSAAPKDIPDPISTEPISSAVSEFTKSITVRGDDKTRQAIAQNLFVKMVRMIKGDFDDTAAINELDIAAINGDPRAMEFDEDISVTPEGEHWNSARNKLRSMATDIYAINLLRGGWGKTLPTPENNGTAYDYYDAEVNDIRERLFDNLYNFTFSLLDRNQKNLLDALPEEDLKAFKYRFSRMATRDFTTTDGITLRASKETNAAARQMIDEAVQLLDGLMFAPVSRAERKMEVRRIATADLGKAAREKHAILGMVKDEAGEVLVHPAAANKYANSFLSSMSAKLDNAVRDFVGLTPSASLRKSLRFNVSDSENVRGVTATPNGQYGDGVYLRSTKHIDKDYDPEQVANAMQDDMRSAGTTPDVAEEVNASLSSIARLRGSIRNLTNKASLSFDERRLLNRMLQEDRQHWEVISEATNGLSVDQKVVPVFARIRAPLDVTSKQTYSLDNSANATARHLLMEMASKQLIDGEGVEAAIEAFGETTTGRELYATITNNDGLMVQSGSAKNGPDARLKFNKMLKDIGYDALHTDEGDVVFDAAMVRDANGFTDTDALLFDGEAYGGDLNLTGQVVEEMMVQNGRLKNPAFVGVAREARRMGMPQPILDVTQKIFKQRGIEERDVQKISKWSTVKNFFRENSSLFRQLGANWFGDKIKPMAGAGTFEMHDAMLARRLQPLIAKLNALPDSGTDFQRWSRRNRGLAMGALDSGQPASHKRIIQALRRGRGAVQKLNPAERQVALDIGKAFADELAKMQALGIRVGDTRKLGSDFYVPQVWDNEAILANPNKFKNSLVEFLRREQMSPDFDGTRVAFSELGKIADGIATKITRGNDPTLDNEIEVSLGNPFASRVLNLKPGDLDFMDDFLVQDLQGIMAKYYDRTIRKRVLTEQFGVNGHAFDAYVDVAENGIAEGVNILKAEYRPSNPVSTESGMGEVDELVIAKLNLSPQETQAMVNRLTQMLGDPETAINNKQVAINMLIEAGGPDGYNNKQYRKRVEAIVNASIDFAAGRPPSTTIVKMRQMMDVLNKKPIDGGDGSEARYKISRLLKSFTSVSLLGFTTFTSIPDVALPLIRSGNMRAFAKTWAKYSTDPSYRAAAKNIGVGIDNLMHERMVHMAGDGNQKFANAFFNATLLTPWTNTMREVASLVGFESFKSEIDRAMKFKRQGKTNTRSYQTAVRYLERYGLTGPNAPHDFLVEGSYRIDSLPKNEAVQMQVQMAMIRFTNESIFTPNPNDLPMWGQTPWGSMMFQLKSFPMLMMKLQGYILDEFKQGNIAPLSYMLTAGVGAGMVAVGVKDYVQIRGGEDERSAEARKRSLTESRAGLAEVLGVDEGDALDGALGWYLDGLLAVGGLGLIGEMLYNSSAQLDNGKYGFVRTMSGIFGPQVGTAELAFNVAAGAGEAVSNVVNDEDSNSKIRTALRDVYGRIPVAGRIYGGPVGREAFVDAVGGEAKKPGRKSSGGSIGFGGSKSSGFGGGSFG